MSRLGKRGIELPKGVEAKLDGSCLSIKGPKGELKNNFRSEVDIKIGVDKIELEPTGVSLFHKSYWGTVASLIANMVEGVTNGFTKILVLEGTGYRMEIVGKEISMQLGFSHPVKLAIPEGLELKANKGELSVTGISKELVGSFSALIRTQKKPEPYKGKGFHYKDEVIERKQGKRTVT